MPAELITVAELSDYIGRGDLSGDPAAAVAVAAACQAVKTIAEQPVISSSSTATLDGTGTDALLLPHVPATKVTSVTIGGETTTDFALASNGVLIKTVGVWTKGRQNVVVKYNHGYASNAIPADLKAVALAYAHRFLTQGPAMAESNGDVNVRYAVASTDFTNGEKMILAKYRTHA